MADQRCAKWVIRDERVLSHSAPDAWTLVLAIDRHVRDEERGGIVIENHSPRRCRGAQLAQVSPLAEPVRLRFKHRTRLDIPPRYSQPPLEDITLDDFEQFAIDRLRVLSEIESCLARGRSNDEMKTTIKQQCAKYLPVRDTGEDTEAQRRKDHIGHFVLRLAFCRSCVS